MYNNHEHAYLCVLLQATFVCDYVRSYDTLHSSMSRIFAYACTILFEILANTTICMYVCMYVYAFILYTVCM